MAFLAALAADLIKTFLAWIGTLLYREIKESKEIRDDNAKAAENSKKVDNAKTPEEKRRANQDLLNGD